MTSIKILFFISYVYLFLPLSCTAMAIHSSDEEPFESDSLSTLSNSDDDDSKINSYTCKHPFQAPLVEKMHYTYPRVSAHNQFCGFVDPSPRWDIFGNPQYTKISDKASPLHDILNNIHLHLWDFNPSSYDSPQFFEDCKTFITTCYIGFDDATFLRIFNKYAACKEKLNFMINHMHPSPFFWAVINGNKLMIKTLLPYVHFQAPYNQSSLYYAVLLQRTAIVKLLLQHHLHPDTPSNHSHESIDALQKTKTIKRNIILLHYKKLTSRTPLHAAIQKNNIDLVKFLIAQGASPKNFLGSIEVTKNTDPKIIDLLEEHYFLSPKLIQQQLFLSKHNKNKILKKQIKKDMRYYPLKQYKDDYSPEEYNEQLIEIMKDYM